MGGVRRRGELIAHKAKQGKEVARYTAAVAYVTATIKSKNDDIRHEAGQTRRRLMRTNRAAAVVLEGAPGRDPVATRASFGSVFS